MGLKARTKQGFDDPVPDTCLFEVTKAEFSNNDDKQTIFSGQVKVVDSVNVADNVDRNMFVNFNLFEQNGKTFSIELFIGFLLQLTGKELDVPDATYFDDVKIQAKIEKKIVGMQVGGVVVPNSYVAKKGPKAGQTINTIQIGEYLTVKEFKEASKNGTGASSPAHSNQGTSDSGGDGDDFLV